MSIDLATVKIPLFTQKELETLDDEIIRAAAKLSAAKWDVIQRTILQCTSNEGLQNLLIACLDEITQRSTDGFD